METFSAALKRVEAELEAVKGKGRGDTSLIAKVEQAVQRDPRACITFDERGFATLRAAGGRWEAGRFETPTLAELKARVVERQSRLSSTSSDRTVRLSVLTGASALSDIGTLQGFADDGSLFQVASQFDCLEATDAFIAPIADYLRDPTQGPRASISAFPGTFVRHYAAPRHPSPPRGREGSTFVQTEQEQLNLLAHFERVAHVNCGYLQTEHVKDPLAFARLLEDDFEQIRVGVHEGVEVVFGGSWSGPIRSPAPRIAQVFTSTWAGGGYSRGDLGPFHDVTLRQLQRGAYLGTFLAAAALGQRRVVTTMIGGGVFGNPAEVIWDAILWSLDQLAPILPAPLEVVVNARSGIDDARRDVVRARVKATGGELIDCHGSASRVSA
jgi:hypothetical protein